MQEEELSDDSVEDLIEDLVNPIHDDSGDDSEVEPHNTKRDWNMVKKFHAELDKVKMESCERCKEVVPYGAQYNAGLQGLPDTRWKGKTTRR